MVPLKINMATYIPSEVLETTIEAIINEATEHITIFYPYDGAPSTLYSAIIKKLEESEIKLTIVFSQFSILENLPPLANDVIEMHSRDVELRVINILYNCCISTEKKAMVILNLKTEEKDSKTFARLVNKSDCKSQLSIDSLNYISDNLEKSYLIYKSRNSHFTIQ
jgi:hypothetical protein